MGTARGVKRAKVEVRYSIVREIAPGVYEVPSDSGKCLYRVDVNQGTCTCPSATYRFGFCKHLKRLDETRRPDR